MRRGPRGGPGEFDARLARAEQLLRYLTGSAHAPLALLVAVLRHQRDRSNVLPGVAPRSVADRFPLLDMERLAPTIVPEVRAAVLALHASVPDPLVMAGNHLLTLTPSELAAFVETWLDDITLVEPRLAFWILVAAGPVLELAAHNVPRPDMWLGTACPVCGGAPQASVIAEASGEFMAGSPRSLVCGRCASWWSFQRVTCVRCGEQDPRHIEAFFDEARRWVRIDTCTACGGYVKTFDLREPGGVDVVPLVDDVATLNLDVWASQRGLVRPAVSLAGV